MFKIASKTAVVAGGTLAVVGVAGAAYAASLSLQSNQLGAGSSAVAACATNVQNITASWVPNTTANSTNAVTAGVTDTKDGFVVKTVDIKGVPSTCVGKTVYISMHDGNAVIGNGSVAIPTGTTTASVLTATVNPVSPATSISASALVGMNILIPN